MTSLEADVVGLASTRVFDMVPASGADAECWYREGGDVM